MQYKSDATYGAAPRRRRSLQITRHKGHKSFSTQSYAENNVKASTSFYRPYLGGSVLPREWLSLEGAICDKAYISGLRKLFPEHTGKFFDYAVAVEDFTNLQIDWKGENTTVQQQAVIKDLGVFNSPDEFYLEYKQEYHGIKKFLYENIGRKIMTKKVEKIRN